MMRSPRWSGAMVLSMAAAIAGCSGTEPSGQPGLTVTSGAGVTDTIQTELPQPLVVQLLDTAGTAVAGQRILFESRNCVEYCPVYVATLGSTEYLTAVEDTTDAKGTASIRVKLGYPAGEGLLRVTAIGRGAVTTATYIVTPGQPAAVRGGPIDTALYVGAHYVLRPITADRFGNAREGDPVTFALVDGPVTVDGSTVTATAIGRARIEARSGPLADTSFVSVVPTGRLAVTWGTLDTTAVQTIELDGSGVEVVMRAGVIDGGKPAWTPDGEIVFESGDGPFGPNRLVVTSAFGLHRLMGDTPEEQLRPRVSDDGVWAYFHTAASFAGEGGSEIWRVHLDGTSAERIGAAGDPDLADIEPDPSPDGTRLAYASSRPDGVLRLVVRDLAGGIDHPSGVPGRLPRWSPSGEWIAYLRDALGSTGSIWLVRPDGSGDHQLSPLDRPYGSSGLDWSPDGAWLIANVGDDQSGRIRPAFELVNVATGSPLPLAWSIGGFTSPDENLFGYGWAAWKPQ